MSGVETGWGAIVTPRYLGPTITLCLGVALLAFNAFLVSTALPTAVGELGGLAFFSWSTTLFLVFAIMGGASAAILKARMGARQALIVSALVFILGSILAANAGSMGELLLGRALQGLGEGIVAAICYALIPELFPSSLVPKVFGAEAVVWAIAAFGGPVLSGLLTETISWRAAFFVNVPLGLIFIGLVLAVVPARGALPEGEGRQSIPIVRLLLIGAAIMAVSLGAVFDSVLFAAFSLVGAGLALAGVVRRDRTAAQKLFPTNAFRLDDVVGSGLWVILLMPVAQSGAAVYLIYTMQQIWGFGPTLAGVVGALMAVSWSLVAILVAGVRSLSGRMLLIRSGPALLVAGLAGATAALLLDAVWLLVIAQVLIGAGFGMSWAYLSQTIMESALPGERDRASGLLPTIQSAGYGIGAAIAGLVANLAGLTGAEDGEGIRLAIVIVFATCAVLGLLGLGAALTMSRRRLALG